MEWNRDADNYDVLNRSDIILAEIGFALLMGLYIPASVLSSSVTDFIDRSTGAFPYDLLTHTAMIYAGFFIIWTTVLEYSQDGKRRRNMSLALWVLLGVGLVNHFFFDPRVGILSSSLMFNGDIDSSLLRVTLNILICAAAAGVFLLLYIRKPAWMKRASAIICAVLLIISTADIWAIHRTMND